MEIEGVNLTAKIMLVERVQALERATTASVKAFLLAAMSKFQPVT
jgi:hypothetical protein